MPQKVEVRLIYPEIFESFTPEVLYSLRAHVFSTLQVLPKKQLKGKKAQPKRAPRLGVVCFGGNLDDAGWPESVEEQNKILAMAKKMDGIALWFDRRTKMPPSKDGSRKYLMQQFGEAKTFDELVEGLKHFIQGIEVALIRRVVVLGTMSGNQPEWKDEEFPLGQPRWIDVPKDRKPREITKEELLSALGVPARTTDTETTPS